MNEDHTTHEQSNAYVLYQTINLDLSDVESQELIKCSTDLYLTLDGEKEDDMSALDAISLHFRQGIVSAIRVNDISTTYLHVDHFRNIDKDDDHENFRADLALYNLNASGEIAFSGELKICILLF